MRFDQKIAADNIMRMADIRNKGKEVGLRVSVIKAIICCVVEKKKNGILLE